MNELFFSEHAQQVTLTRELHDALGKGFILSGLPELSCSAVTVLATITPLPDDTFSIKCGYLGPRESTEDGTAMHDWRDLGYLTQHAVHTLQRHQHGSRSVDLKFTIP